MVLEVKTDASRQCVLAVALPLLGHHMVSPSLHHTNLFHLLVPAIKERLCSIKSDADPGKGPLSEIFLLGYSDHVTNSVYFCRET